jgi:pullulanase
MHNNGLSVIMDVVYNHVYNASEFCFNKIVPQYFTRIDENGTYSNGSGCGNDTASERSMVRKYIVESVLYWAEEYHIDGFRFDLVGLIDTETINEIVETVHAVRPDVVFYGEGWSMNTGVTKFGVQMATQVNSKMTPGFAYFSDTIRDALKGSVFNNTETGYISGATGKEATLEKCFIGLAYPWCSTPSQCINYASCHDNMTLFDRIVNSTPDASREDQIKMNNLAAAIYMTSQGIPFVHAGEEMLRSKPLKDGSFDHNSYASPDSVNKLKWDDLNSEEYQDVYKYYQGLIAFRKEHAALRMTTAEEVKANITALEGLEKNVMAFHINGGVNGEVADNLFVIFNGNETETEITLPEGKWNVYIDAENAGTEVLRSVKGTVKVEGISAMVLCQDGNKAAGVNGGVLAGLGAVVLAAGAAVAVVLKKKKK